jgi:hypothetical protein
MIFDSEPNIRGQNLELRKNEMIQFEVLIGNVREWIKQVRQKDVPQNVPGRKIEQAVVNATIEGLEDSLKTADEAVDFAENNPTDKEAMQRAREITGSLNVLFIVARKTLAQ